MSGEQFEALLDLVVSQLTEEARQTLFSTSKAFENRVRDVLQALSGDHGIKVDYDPHPYAFPDISVGEFGIEVKFTANDTWRSVANSILETFRNMEVVHIYVIFGKMGGTPEVKWSRYADCVIHVRTSHVPRFELEIDAKCSLFSLMEVTYNEFRTLPVEGKMHYIRKYAKNRLKAGERLWWLEEKAEPDHSLPIQVRIYTQLPPEEKLRLRAEATLLCPRIVGGSRVRDKYNDVALYLLTYHGVLVTQARDLFSAGSVAHAADRSRGGIYIQRALAALEGRMIEASVKMEDALFLEYWGESVPPAERIKKWLTKADQFARGWIPSQTLFQQDQP